VIPSHLARRRLLVLVLACGVLGLAVLTEQVRAPDRRDVGWLGTAIEGALAPVVGIVARAGDLVGEGWALLHEIGTLRAENARLAAEVARLKEENARLRPAAEEASRLRSLLALKQSEPFASVAARVIGRDPSHWFSSLLVDRGTRDGVRRNDPVVTSEGLVGRVIEVGGSWSRVLLIVDPRSAVSVVVVRSRETGVAEGLGRPLLRVTYLSRDASIQPGDLVETSGLGQIYPRGVPVGTVVGVSRPPGDLFQEAVVRPAVDLGHLDDVLILLRPSPGEPAR
jgi:rod shape-determining protein MreC